MSEKAVVAMDKIVCVEQYGSNPLRRQYGVTSVTPQYTSTSTPGAGLSGSASQAGVVVLNVTQTTERFTSITQFFRSVFLPQGYPESVSRDYLKYQIWDTVQAFSSSITGALATQAVLQGAGVGDESASVLAATLTWLMKDGTGMVGRIIFAWMQGTYLDCDCKRWRLFADILNDCAICLEILAPYFKESFRLIVCFSGLCKSIVGVAGGATRAALTQHQARRNNMADVSAKDGSQETLVNLAALICSLMLIPVVTGNPSLIWTLFLMFTGLHLFANYQAVTSVSMETFNQTRLNLACKSFFGSSHLPAVDDVNKMEPVIWKLKRKLRVYIGVSLNQLIKEYGDLEKLLKIFGQDNYLLWLDNKKGIIYVSFHANATTADQLKACFNAEVLEYAMASKAALVASRDQLYIQRVSQALNHGDVWSAISHSQAFVRENYQTFADKAQAVGWDINKVLLCAEEWRAEWDLTGVEGKKSF